VGKRVNIGNARLYGFEEDLRMKGNQFQIAVSITFVTYLVGQYPSVWTRSRVSFFCFFTKTWESSYLRFPVI
jgi:hypothetical protein